MQYILYIEFTCQENAAFNIQVFFLIAYGHNMSHVLKM